MSVVAKVEPADMSTERDLLIALIISDEVCNSVLPLLQRRPGLPNPLTDASQTLVRWVKEYWLEYGQAPFQNMRSLYEEKKSTLTRSGELEFIDIVLESLNDRYAEELETGSIETFNSQFAIDRFKKYLTERRAVVMAKTVLSLEERGRLDEVPQVIDFYQQSLSVLQAAGFDLNAYAMDIEEVVKKEIEPARVFIDPWLTDGCLFEIFGIRGVGKSWLAYVIALCMTRVSPKTRNIGTWTATQPGGVFLLDGEMPIKAIQKRFQGLLNYIDDGKRKRPFTFLSTLEITKQTGKPFLLTEPEVRNMLTQYFVNHTEYDLLILDNVAALCPGLVENSKEDWDPINQWLLGLRAIGLSVGFIHHAGKSGDQRGTSGREDALDVIINLKRPPDYEPPDGAYFEVRLEKARNVDPADAGDGLRPFTLRIIDKSFAATNMTSWEAGEIGRSRTRDEIIGLLLDRPEWTQTQIGRAVNRDRRYVSRVKQRAVKEGLMDKDRNALPDGEEYLREILFDPAKYDESPDKDSDKNDKSK